MACSECIQRWLLQEPSCPHCRAPLRRDQLVNCRWADEVTQHLDAAPLMDAASAAAQQADADLCALHGTRLSAFCNDCNTCARLCLFSLSPLFWVHVPI